MGTFNTVDMSPSVFPQESGVGETLVAEATSQIRVSRWWVDLPVEVVFQFGVV